MSSCLINVLCYAVSLKTLFSASAESLHEACVGRNQMFVVEDNILNLSLFTVDGVSLFPFLMDCL